MNIKTTRFGQLEVNPNDVITFSEGLLGFENLKKYFVVDPGDSTLILWLQSTEDEKVAFPIIEPKIFKPDYIAKLLPADLNGLELDTLQTAKLYSILTIPANVTEMSANLKAPVVVNSAKKVGKQIVLQDYFDDGSGKAPRYYQVNAANAAIERFETKVIDRSASRTRSAVSAPSPNDNA